MVQNRVTIAVAVWVAGLLGLACAGKAVAGGYHVYSCRTPGGAVAPTDGWTPYVAPGGAYDDYAMDTCGAGGSLVAALGDQTIHEAGFDAATWTFEAPKAETIASATLWRAGDVHGTTEEYATYQFWLAGSDEKDILDECLYTRGCREIGTVGQPFAEDNHLTSTSKLSNLDIKASCGVDPGQECKKATGDANGYAAAVYLYAADIILDQTVGPTASNVSGELATAPAVRGSSDVAFDASDPGSGVYEAVFSIDGQVVQNTVVDANGGRCHDVGGTSDGKPAFEYVQPCKPSVSVDVPFDTTRVSDGAHHLIVSVIDAAGNSAPVFDRAITVANPPPVGAPNGTNASTQANLAASWAGSRKTGVAGGYGHAHTIAGRLTAPGGTPIAGAEIDCTAIPAYQGARAVAMACPRTGANGRFAVRVAGGVGSRTIRLAYRAHIGDALPAATRTLGLVVRAGVRLRVTPHTTRVGRSIRFTGALQGGPIPRGGKQVVLEARSPGGPWIEFDVVRTNRKGRYRDSYRFKFPGPVDYRFRAVSEGAADYPYATGASNVVRVRER
jgi:hypothetical protein